MATPDDAAAGFRYFADSDATATYEEINGWLRDVGHAPVSPRMYRHYNKLWRLGYRQYLTINRLDTRTVKDPVWDPRPSQITEPTDESIELRFDYNGAPFDVVGRAVEVGAAGFVAHIDNEPMTSVFERARGISARLHVRFSDRGSNWMPAELSSISSNQRRRFSVIRCVFERFGSIEELQVDSVASSSIEVSCGTASTALTVAEAAQLAFWLHETLEATRRAAALVHGIDLAVPRLRRMRYGSQWVALVDVALQHKDVVLSILGGRALFSIPDRLKSLEDFLSARSKRREETSPEVVEHRRRMRAAELRTAEANATASENQVDGPTTSASDVAAADAAAVSLFGSRYAALSPEERKLVRLALAQALQGHARISAIAPPLRIRELGRDT